jgi:hypothetical protein
MRKQINKKKTGLEDGGHVGHIEVLETADNYDRCDTWSLYSGCSSLDIKIVGAVYSWHPPYGNIPIIRTGLAYIVIFCFKSYLSIKY